MSSEQIGEYEIEYTGMRLPIGNGWAAHLAIYGPSPNPMHRNSIFPGQRVSIGAVFQDEAAAEAEAHKVALAMLDASASRR
ncbi:MAG TPA: hypothetical protein DCW29_13640 [Janthinobacterium sp.]|nr:hypothetical protein [Janthinobacterium sp.]